ncbi:MAG TPA: hypothetical protein VIA98_13805 [Allosphingosinicella sp.]|jgi:hypothetical protein
MKTLAILLTAAAALPLSACATNSLVEPKTPGEINTGYNYVPVDPIEVTVLIDGRLVDAEGQFPASTSAKIMQAARYQRCVPRSIMDDADEPAPKTPPEHSADVMDALPDHTIRMAIREVSGKTEGGFGPVGLSVAGSSYQVVADSIFADATNVRLGIRVTDPNNNLISLAALPKQLPTGTKVEVRRGEFEKDGSDKKFPVDFEDVRVPVYVGIGLRLTANLIARKANLKLSNLPAIAASADANQSTGTLTLQTLGVFNQQVASTFAIPTELSSTSVQNALVSLGAVKAILYDRDTGKRPRVTGIYNPLPTSDPLLINKIYTALASAPISWRPCGAS